MLVDFHQQLRSQLHAHSGVVAQLYGDTRIPSHPDLTNIASSGWLGAKLMLPGPRGTTDLKTRDGQKWYLMVPGRYIVLAWVSHNIFVEAKCRTRKFTFLTEFWLSNQML